MAEVIDGILIREVETKNIMTKSSLPVGGYSVNPYVGCTHACKYCYARNNVKRWHMIDDFTDPEFFPGKLRICLLYTSDAADE